MGTIVITQFQDLGTSDDPLAPVYGEPLATTLDATTGATGVQVPSDGRARYLSVTSVSGAHRVNVNSSATTGADSVYVYVAEGVTVDLRIKGGNNFVYRTA